MQPGLSFGWFRQKNPMYTYRDPCIALCAGQTSGQVFRVQAQHLQPNSTASGLLQCYGVTHSCGCLSGWHIYVYGPEVCFEQGLVVRWNKRSKNNKSKNFLKVPQRFQKLPNIS